MKITLASGSPRRAKILEELGVEFDVVSVESESGDEIAAVE